MNENEIKRFVVRLRQGAIKKSIVAAAIIAFSLLAVCVGIGWYLGFQNIWVYPILFVSAVITTAPLFYFFKYRKKGREVAAAIDQLGLEERLLTMESLKSENTYIAKRQREDTIQALKTVNEKRLSLTLSTALLVCLAIALPFGAGAATVSALAAGGVLPYGNEVAAGIPQKYTIQYSATEGGILLGSTAQYIAQGETGAYIIAIPDEGYIFLKWNDDFADTARRDTPADGDIKVKAIFVALDDYNADEELFNPDKKENGDNKKGTGSEKSNDDLPPSEDESNQGGQQFGGGAGGGVEDESGYVIDGKTYYGNKLLNDAEKAAIERVNNDPNLTDRDKELIDRYYQSISR